MLYHGQLYMPPDVSASNILRELEIVDRNTEELSFVFMLGVIGCEL
jgi:hypothetical protein